ncbi:MAG: hypothetical protein ABEI07_01875, partial [Candidatus Nanohaloarchaea archaeon]
MREMFLREGAAAYVGASTVNYAPFSSEIDTRFFSQGYTVGQSLRKAVNSFAQDSMTWDPVNILARNNVKGKMIRSFRLFGNPEMGKDPSMEEPDFRKEVECKGSGCTLTFNAEVNHSVVRRGGKRTLKVKSDDHLMRSFRPIIPLLEAEHYLPPGTEILGQRVRTETQRIENVSVPRVTPLSHGGTVLRRAGPGDWFPANTSTVRVRRTIDGRRKVSITQAAFRYSPENRTAEVVEEVEVVLRYRSRYGMQVDAEDSVRSNTSVNVSIWNRGGREEAELMVQVRGREKVREKNFNVTLRNGTNRFELPFQLDRSGEFELRAFLFVGNATLGPRSDLFVSGKEAREISLNISAPDSVMKGERFGAVITIRNRDDSSRHLKLNMNGSGGLQTAFLESPQKEIELSPGDSSVWRIALRAFKTGKASLHVQSGRLSEQEDILVKRSRKKGFQEISRGDSRILKLERPRGKIVYSPGVNTSSTRLVTERFSAIEKRYPDERVLEVEKESGGIRIRMEEGEVHVERENGV